MKIRYVTSHGVAERISFEDGEADTLTLVFEPAPTGAVVINGKIYATKDGEVKIPLAMLADGEYKPTLESEGGIYLVEGFKKQGRSIILPSSDEAAIRRLILRCYKLEREMAAMKKRTRALEKTCSGHHIFDFERKEQ